MKKQFPIMCLRCGLQKRRHISRSTGIQACSKFVPSKRKKCQHCGKQILGNPKLKFCSNRCACLAMKGRKYAQPEIRRRCEKEDCGKIFTTRNLSQSFCSVRCSVSRRTSVFPKKGDEIRVQLWRKDHDMSPYQRAPRPGIDWTF